MTLSCQRHWRDTVQNSTSDPACQAASTTAIIVDSKHSGEKMWHMSTIRLRRLCGAYCQAISMWDEEWNMPVYMPRVGWGEERRGVSTHWLAHKKSRWLSTIQMVCIPLNKINWPAWSPTTTSSSSSLFAIRKNIRVYKCKGQTGCQKRLIHRAGRPW